MSSINAYIDDFVSLSGYKHSFEVYVHNPSSTACYVMFFVVVVFIRSCVFSCCMAIVQKQICSVFC